MSQEVSSFTTHKTTHTVYSYMGVEYSIREFASGSSDCRVYLNGITQLKAKRHAREELKAWAEITIEEGLA